ncbi:hypothetical protein PUNSTDRAFT_116011 [Punctularia strigosozonata HHB-11173 SS5]|uniref:Uncharacterized protein n=1 Tax=Punctularia strigosozonata (strain HHB-11173) TaxID=741275 RepID=R7S4B3_PUNST|nr:uncharacterized protein PUNSTDRAFT_116011 [Punctularia strigosozonata HHB-11173 SS5]EIN05063.1 hypothetical protein PUNSTDRAFT_116011 [Punctularia strigosozonata HHB-11173 SS5]
MRRSSTRVGNVQLWVQSRHLQMAVGPTNIGFGATARMTRTQHPSIQSLTRLLLSKVPFSRYS